MRSAMRFTVLAAVLTIVLWRESVIRSSATATTSGMELTLIDSDCWGPAWWEPIDMLATLWLDCRPCQDVAGRLVLLRAATATWIEAVAEVLSTEVPDTLLLIFSEEGGR